MDKDRFMRSCIFNTDEIHVLTIPTEIPSVVAAKNLPRVQRRQWASAASPSTGPQCGTVYHQHCVTAACHWTRLGGCGGWRIICLVSYERHLAPLWRFSAILAPDMSEITYLKDLNA